MRKLLLTTAIVLIASSAFASGPRGLSAPQPAEPQKPFRQAEVTILRAPGEQPTATETAPQTMQDKLKAAGELKPDGTPANPPQAQVPRPAPVQQPPIQQAAPAQIQPKPVVQAQPVQRHAKKRVAHRRESTGHKARRIAAKFGIYW